MKQKISIISELQDRVRGKNLLIAPAHERSRKYANLLKEEASIIGYYDRNEALKEYQNAPVIHIDDLASSEIEIIVITSLSFADTIARDIKRVLPHVEIIKIKDLLTQHQHQEIQKRCQSKRKIEPPFSPGETETTKDYTHLVTPLIQWFDLNGKAGYDPYDFEDYLIQKLKTRYRYLEGTPKSLVEQWKKEEFETTEINQLVTENQFNPKALREMLGIKPRINAKALGLNVWAYARLYRHTEKIDYLLRAKDNAQWLLENNCTLYKGKSWGYPFDWQSMIFIPAGTPSTTVSVNIGNGFYQLYKATAEKKYLEACKEICVFIQHSINRTYKEHGLCFSYTPLDTFQVNNANLFTAEYLIRIGLETENFYWVDLGKAAATFVLSEQNSDGSIYYWSKAQDHHSSRAIDIYHTALKIRTLKNIGILSADETYIKASNRLFDFFQKYFFNQDGTIKKDKDINIHGIADTILTLCNQCNPFDKTDPTYTELLEKLVQETLSRYQYNPGAFSYKIYPDGKRVDFPYYRWGQAWMFRALTEYILYKESSPILAEDTDVPITMNINPPEKIVTDMIDLFHANSKIDETETGIYFIKKAISSNIQAPRLYEILIQYHSSRNQMEQSDFYLGQAMQRYPGSREIWKRYLEYLVQNNRLTEAFREIQQNAANSSPKRELCEILIDFIKDDEKSYFATSGYGTKTWIDNFYNTSESDPWNHHRRGTQIGRYHESISLLKEDGITEKPHLDVLDIGCALGHFTHLLKERLNSPNIIGIDLGEKAVERATKLWKQIEFQQGSLPVLSFPDNSFDLITALEVVSYQKSIGPRLLQWHEMKRVLKKNGYILFSICLGQYPYYTREELIEFFPEIDLEIVSIKYRHHSHYDKIEQQLIDNIKFLENLRNSDIEKTQLNQLINMAIDFTANPEMVNLFEKQVETFDPEEQIPSHIIALLKKASSRQ